jgi:hypothetical protein
MALIDTPMGPWSARNRWLSYLLWEGLPFLMPMGLFAVVAAINWDYESKLLFLNKSSPDWIGVHMGPLMLGTGLGFSLFGSVVLLVVRLAGGIPKSDWARFIIVTLVALFCIFPSVFIVIFGPAQISIMESMQQVPDR